MIDTTDNKLSAFDELRKLYNSIEEGDEVYIDRHISGIKNIKNKVCIVLDKRPPIYLKVRYQYYVACRAMTTTVWTDVKAIEDREPIIIKGKG